MIRHELLKHLDHSDTLPAPPQNGSIYPFQLCPCFQGQITGIVPIMETCFFCQYGDFQKTKERALEIGVCCYPNIQIR